MKRFWKGERERTRAPRRVMGRREASMAVSWGLRGQGGGARSWGEGGRRVASVVWYAKRRRRAWEGTPSERVSGERVNVPGLGGWVEGGETS